MSDMRKYRCCRQIPRDRTAPIKVVIIIAIFHSHLPHLLLKSPGQRGMHVCYNNSQKIALEVDPNHLGFPALNNLMPYNEIQRVVKQVGNMARRC